MKAQSDKIRGVRGTLILPSFVSWSAVVLLLAVPGCRQEPTTVSGFVSLDGQPLTIGDGVRGTVVFQPAGGGAILNGIVDPNGKYHLTAGSNRSVSPGNYIATISAVRITPPSADNPQPSGERVTPEKYANASESDLRVEVAPGPNNIDLIMISDEAFEKDDADRPEATVETVRESPAARVDEATQ